MTDRQLYLSVCAVIAAYVLIRLGHAWNAIRTKNREIEQRMALREQQEALDLIQQQKNVRVQSSPPKD